jgi:high-affinity iron transporter
MLAALIIVFREILEAGIVIGVVLAASQGVARRGRWIVFGIVGGVLGSGIVALFARRISNLFDGSGQELLNAAILGIAVVMLVWTIVWMAKHGRKMAAELTAVGHDVQEGKRPLAALAIAVGMAVLREGAEVVLFLYGVVTTGGESPADIALGGAAGILLGAATSFVLYRSLVAIPLRYLFKTTGILISLLAAGLAAQSVGIIQSAGFVQLMSDPLWNTGRLLSDDSPVGDVLHTLIGYTAQPTGMQLTGYVLTLLAIIVLSGASTGQRRRIVPVTRGRGG